MSESRQAQAAALLGQLYSDGAARSRRFYLEQDYRLLNKWGRIYSRQFEWYPSLGVSVSVCTDNHPTAEATDAQTRELALEAGYIPPKWWQWWRWKEYPLPAAIQGKQKK